MPEDEPQEGSPEESPEEPSEAPPEDFERKKAEALRSFYTEHSGKERRSDAAPPPRAHAGFLGVGWAAAFLSLYLAIAFPSKVQSALLVAVAAFVSFIALSAEFQEMRRPKDPDSF